jgi:hypothetical protein
MVDKRAPRVLVIGLLALMLSCGGEVSEEKKSVAKVNDYVITADAFRRELSASVRFHDVVGLTLEDKRDCLDSQIRKELLIQEASRLGLDREETFRQTIEAYWEQTLITALLKHQMARLEKEILVTRDEIEQHYRQLSQNDPNPAPLEEMKTLIEKAVREEKKTEATEKWIKDLWNAADITIYEENLKALR